MADFIAMPLFKATIGWLIEKGRTLAAKKLRHGDVLEQLLCNIVAPEFDKINSKLDASARKHLGAAISAFRVGVKRKAEGDELDGPTSEQVKKDANKRFKSAHKEASLAFHDASLGAEDRIFAAYIRIMAQLRQNADDPSLALTPCKQFLEEMHEMEEVKNNFYRKCHPRRMWKRFPKKVKKRLDNIISPVCDLNRILFDITQMIGGSKHLFVWPCVTYHNGDLKEEIDPLRDSRLEVGMEVMWTFGQQEEVHKLICPRSIASNSEGQYLVVDSNDVKVFDRSGKYQYLLPGLQKNFEFQYHVVDIDTDQRGTVYLLVSMVGKGHAKGWYEVFVLEKECKPRHFPLRNTDSKGRKLAVNQQRDETELLVLEGERDLHAMVQVYDTSGTFVDQFGERILQDAQDIVGANDGHTYVLDKCHEFNKRYIREFGARRDQLRRVDVASEAIALAFHQPSGHIVFISRTPEEVKKLWLFIYNKQNKSVRTHPLDVYEIPMGQNVAVTDEGRIVVVVAEQISGQYRGKVIVF